MGGHSYPGNWRSSWDLGGCRGYGDSWVVFREIWRESIGLDGGVDRGIRKKGWEAEWWWRRSLERESRKKIREHSQLWRWTGFEVLCRLGDHVGRKGHCSTTQRLGTYIAKTPCRSHNWNWTLMQLIWKRTHGMGAQDQAFRKVKMWWRRRGWDYKTRKVSLRRLVVCCDVTEANRSQGFKKEGGPNTHKGPRDM